MALGIDGLRVGTWTHGEVPTGCTVLLPPPGALAALAVRGESPGTREAAALGPFGRLSVVHGIVLSGGSAHGLAAADGVVRWLEEQGTGYGIGDDALVPIVGAAIVLDLAVGLPDARPGPVAGRAACEAAVEQDPAEGAVGAGAGCSVAKVAGLAHAWRGGQGLAVQRHGDLVVGALVVNNAAGELLEGDGSVLLATRAPASAPRWPLDLDHPGAPADAVLDGEIGECVDGEVEDRTDDRANGGAGTGPTGNTVIGAVVTNARLGKLQAYRVADLAHDGVARAVDPAHTSVDGDALFCVATGEVAATVDRVALLAARAVATAARRGPRLAAGVAVDGPWGSWLPGAADADRRR